MACSMTPEERSLLQDFGSLMCGFALTTVGIQALLYGISAPIFAGVLALSIKRKSWGQVAIVSLAFAASTAHFVLERTISFLMVATLKTPPTLLQAIQAYNKRAAVLGIPGVWINTIAPVLNDCFIAWRAWVLFRRSQWVMSVLGFLCLATLDLLVIGVVSVALQSTPTSYVSASNSNNAASKLNNLSVILSLATNGAATAVIGWILRRLKLEPTDQKLFNVWRIVAFLVESGAIYGVLQIIYVILLFAIPDGAGLAAAIAFNVVGSSYNAISVCARNSHSWHTE
ncbi:hypothetical protein H0H93_014484 [Arthromyces matolae]|nr:hypothetical protein H0H93_014484 [Arthromyces matolae]